jgi:HlyD family secretion protein
MMSDVPMQASSSSPEVSRGSLEQLDALVRVTTIQSWVCVATLFCVCVSAVAFAVLYPVPIKVNGEGILLIERDTLLHVRAPATGRLLSLKVKLGDWVSRGDPIGEVSQDELRDAIREGELKLADLERENQRLSSLEQLERETQGAAIAKIKEAVASARRNSEEKLKLAQKIVKSDTRLHNDRNLGDMEFLQSQEKLFQIHDDIHKGHTRLAELELDWAKSQSLRGRAQEERQVKIEQVKTKLQLDQDKLCRNSRIVSHVYGQVAQTLIANDDLVKEGSPVVLLHSPRAERGGDDPDSPYESIVFVPAGEGKKIEVRNSVEVSPATVKREEHGFIRGEVVSVSELPATRLAMEAALAHPELVDNFLKRFSPGVLLRVHIKLDELKPSDVAARVRAGWEDQNPFHWSSSSGPAQPLKTGTMCQAAIVVKKQRLINLILPWTKGLVGAG